MQQRRRRTPCSLVNNCVLSVTTGIYDATKDMQHCLGQAKRRADQWRLCKVLVIDEVSMLDAEYLEKVWYGMVPLWRHCCVMWRANAALSPRINCLCDGTILCRCDGVNMVQFGMMSKLFHASRPLYNIYIYIYIHCAVNELLFLTMRPAY
jgi:hypothetical protein